MSKKEQNMFPRLEYVPQKRLPLNTETVTDVDIDFHTGVVSYVDQDLDTCDSDMSCIFGSDTGETENDETGQTKNADTFPWANYFAGMSNKRNRLCTGIFVPRHFCIYI